MLNINNKNRQTTFKSTNTSDKNTKLSVFYINDIHGNISCMNSLINVSKKFDDTFEKDNKKIDILKLSAGDVNIGDKKEKNSLWEKFLNDNLKIKYSAIGNHELDYKKFPELLSADNKNIEEKSTPNNEWGNFLKDITKYNLITHKKIDLKKLPEFIFKEKINLKYLACNIIADKNSAIDNCFKNKKIEKSHIEEINGHKYGIIGASPIDFEKVINPKHRTPGVTVNNYENTLNSIKTEIEKLKEQNVNKIILLSHLGYELDKKVAQNVSDIDIIIGGHSHDKINGITPGKNLQKSPAGEPVIITQAGKNGEYFGLLDIVFDEKGVIKSAFNSINHVNKWPKENAVENIKDLFLGKATTIARFSKACTPKDPFTQENPIANLVTDAIRIKSGAQIAITNSAKIRRDINAGIITDRDIREMLPFRENNYKVNLKETELVDAIKQGIKSLNVYPYRPGLLQVSGLNYKIGKDKQLKELNIKNPDGSLSPININNPDPNKTYSTIYNEFLFRGKEGMDSLKKEKDFITYEWSEADAVNEYLKQFNNTPIKLSKKNRIINEAKYEKPS